MTGQPPENYPPYGGYEPPGGYRPIKAAGMHRPRSKGRTAAIHRLPGIPAARAAAVWRVSSPRAAAVWRISTTGAVRATDEAE